jgi:hypothetical protein
MSKDLLIKLQKECMELGAAGSELGKGNIKLQKLLPKFEKLGQKIKPFKMVYDRINALLNSEKDESENNLISLFNLINAILSTQAETDIEGEIEFLEGNSIEKNTNISNHLISPVVQALTTKGGGRYNVIEEAFKDEIFSDFRLIPLLIKGLDDKYSEIAQLIYKKLLEDNKPELLPLLKESFHRQGKKGDALKLSLIGQIIKEEARELCIDLLEDSSKEVKVEAINILGNLKDTESILLQQAKSKIKDIRKAAYFALVKINSELGREELEKALKKTDADIVLEAIQSCESLNYGDVLLAGFKDTYTKLLKKETEKDNDKILNIINEMKKHRSEEILEFFMQCMEEDIIANWKREKHSRTIEVEREVVSCISEYENIPENIRYLIESRKDRNNNKFFDLAFKISLKSRKPEEIYDMYSPNFINETINKDMAMKTIDTFSEYLGYKATYWRIGVDIWSRHFREKDVEAILKPIKKEFDKRWIEIFKKYQYYSILSYTLDKNDIDTVEFMLNHMKNYEELNKDKQRYREFSQELIDVIIGLVKIGHEEAYEMILNIIKSAAELNSYSVEYALILGDILLLVPYLPEIYLLEIKKFIIKLREIYPNINKKYSEAGVKK